VEEQTVKNCHIRPQEIVDKSFAALRVEEQAVKKLFEVNRKNFQCFSQVDDQRILQDAIQFSRFNNVKQCGLAG
jgi:hypothetical protein